MNFETSEQIDQIATALAKAQGGMTNPERNRTVNVRPKTGGSSWAFAYATYDTILTMLRPVLAENGLAITQAMSTADGKARLTTQVTHSSGQWMRAHIPIIVEDGHNMQALGSAITYARRYGLSALLNIASEEDDDGNAASGNQVERSQMKPAPKPITPAPAVEPADRTRMSGDSPSPDKAQETKDAYKRLKKAIETANTERTIDDIFKLQAKTLEAIREVSAAGAQALEELANAKRQQLKDQEG